MFVFCSAADAVSSGSMFIVLGVSMLNVTMLIVFLPLSSFGLGPVVAFFNTGA